MDKGLLQVERLWSTVARNRRNIVPVLDFLLAHAFSDSDEGLGLQVCPHSTRRDIAPMLDLVLKPPSVLMFECEQCALVVHTFL